MVKIALKKQSSLELSTSKAFDSFVFQISNSIYMKIYGYIELHVANLGSRIEMENI